MNLRRCVLALAVMAICGTLLLWSTTTAKDAFAQDVKDKSSAAKDPKSADSKSAQTDTVSIRYAKAQLRVAELTLMKAKELNRKVPGTLIPSMMSQFYDEVEFAKLRLDTLPKGDKGAGFEGYLQRCEIDLRFAEARLKKAIEVDKKIPGEFEPIDLERLKLNVEMGQLRLERGRALANGPADAKLQWQIEMLNEATMQLKQQISLSVQNRLATFF